MNGRNRRRHADTETKVCLQPPSLAITAIVLMRNEEHRIGPCLDSILNNSFPENEMEILVVDGMSTDSSRCVVAERAAKHPSVRLLDNPARIVPNGLNIGIREARGRIIIIIGAHAEYPRDYIPTCVRELDRVGADVVGGTLITRPGADTLVARAVALMTRHPFGVGGSAFRTGKTNGFVDTVPYGAYRRDVFEQVGLFNESLARNQDFEFNARVRASGRRLFLSPSLWVNYYNVPTFRRLAAQAFSNGLWLTRMWFLSPTSFRLRHAAPLVLVNVLLLCLLLAPVTRSAVVIGLLIAAMYAAAVTVAAGQISWRHGAKYFFPLLTLFATHHLVYGVGTLVSLLAPGWVTSGTPH